MQQFELGNLMKVKQQFEQKISLIENLKDKIQNMSNQMTYQGYQKVNSVMMRKVQIKHTSEFIIKLNDEYFAEVKTQATLQNLQRKKSSYEQQLKKLASKIELLEKKIKKTENKQKDNDFLDKYDQSTIEVIGTNQQGESIFNIIEVEGQQDNDVSEWKNNNKQKEKELLKNEKKETQNKKKEQQQVNKPKKNKQKQENQAQLKSQQRSNQNKVEQQTGYEIQGDEDILFDNQKSQDEQNQLSDIDEDQQENEGQQKQKTTQIKRLNPSIQRNQEINKQQKKQDIESVSFKQNLPKKIQKSTGVTQINMQKKVDKKVESLVQQQEKPVMKKTQKPAPQKVQPAKPISKFKLQRMKQKLQQKL